MPDPLRLVNVNLAYADTVTSAESLVARYHTLTGWSRALTAMGASVHVVQRFATDTRLDVDGVPYQFVRDGRPGTPAPWTQWNRVLHTVAQLGPDVVHVNGLMFPGMVVALRSALPATSAIVLQDHSGHVPRVRPWLSWRTGSRARWRRAFAAADACTFTASDLAARWFAVGLGRDTTVLEIPEASSEIAPIERAAAIGATGISASPAILWVGRLDANKDPLTALAALEIAYRELPDAHCWMIYSESVLADAVRRRVSASSDLRGRVTCVGAVPHSEMAKYYSASDIFLSASHHEGSGYALIEAMACGVVPCVTDIPAFRALTGACGARWPVGDARAAAAALIDLAGRDRERERSIVRRRFADASSWAVIARTTLTAYAALAAARRAAGP